MPTLFECCANAQTTQSEPTPAPQRGRLILLSRSQIIALITETPTHVFFTLKDDKYGSQLHVVCGLHGVYLRTDPNGTEADNLSDLDVH